MNSWHLKIRCILQEKSHQVMEERKDDSETPAWLAVKEEVSWLSQEQLMCEVFRMRPSSSDPLPFQKQNRLNIEEEVVEGLSERA